MSGQIVRVVKSTKSMKLKFYNPAKLDYNFSAKIVIQPWSIDFMVRFAMIIVFEKRFETSGQHYLAARSYFVDRKQFIKKPSANGRAS